MSAFKLIAVVLTVTALFSYVNFKWIRLPTTIGVMMIALVLSLGLIGLQALGVGFEWNAREILGAVSFDETMMKGMLSFLLFAAALHINLNDLANQKVEIAVLAVGGVVLSMAVFGTAVFYILRGLGDGLPYGYCLLFAALISPTDPIAVLAMLKGAKLPKSLETTIAGESLFNDGIGVVAFIMVSEVALGGRGVSVPHVGLLFLQEAVGGAVFGLVLGWIAYLLLKSVDDYQVEVLLTLALVSGGYAAALAWHTSGPIAIVVAGVLIGNQGRRFAMSERTRERLDVFWELIDGILNAVLFVLIGLEILVLTFTGRLLLAGLAAIPALLFARWVSVATPMTIMRPWRKFKPGTVRILTWGGLRGGISVAMALSLPAGQSRDLIVAMTYVVVVFSILVQGLTLNRLVSRVYPT